MTREALRSRPVQTRSQEMVSRILDATAQVLTARGYDGLSTNRVAEQAGVSIGSLYRYFEDKEQLVEQLRRRVNDELLAELTESMIRSSELEPYAGTRTVLVTLVEGLERHRGVMRALIDGVPMGSQANRLPEVERQLSQFARLGVASRLPGTAARRDRGAALPRDGDDPERLPADRARTPAGPRPRTADRPGRLDAAGRARR